MTVQVQTPINSAVGNGVTTVFPYTFRLLSISDLKVYVAGVLQTPNAAYTVSGIGAAAGGNVTFTSPPASGASVVLVREMTLDRQTDYQQQGDFLATTVNADIGRPVMLVQDLAVRQQRSISAPSTEPTAAMTLPARAARALKYLFFNANGDADVGVPIASTLSQSIFDGFLNTAALFLNGIAARKRQGTFILPATLRFYGDSFFIQPNPHTSGDSMAQKAAAQLGLAANISAASGNTIADRQDAIFAYTPVATDALVIGLGQNDSQFIGTGTDVERRLNDVALLHLAAHFHLGTPAGSRRVLASAMAQSGTWAADGEIPEGGALVSSTISSVLQATLSDTRFVVVIFKMKVGSGGRFRVIIDGNVQTDAFDGQGYRSAPFGNLPTNTGKTYARAALVFDTGRRKPVTAVQVEVLSATNVANTVSVLQIIGLSGDPLAGPLVGVCDLTDRTATGWATAAGSQAALPIISRLINQSAAVAAAAGLRVVPLPISTAVNPNTALVADGLHPNEAGATAAATTIAAGLQQAARDFSVSREDLYVDAMINGANGYVLLSQSPLALGADGQIKRQRLSPRAINWEDAIPCRTSLRIVFDDGSGAFNLTQALFLSREAGDAGVAYVGNLGNGNFNLVAFGTSRARQTQTQFELLAGHTLKLPIVAVASLPSAATAGAGARAHVSDANATTFASIVAGGGGNAVPVYSDGTNWRIG